VSKDGWLIALGVAVGLIIVMNVYVGQPLEEAVNDSSGSNPTFVANLTPYGYISNATLNASAMEGGPKSADSKALISLEQHLADPSTYPYVSVSGDLIEKINPLGVWPYGQRLSIDAFPGAVFRVVDIGHHFANVALPGWGKVYRVTGHEPLDICINAPGSTVFTNPATVTIYPGDVLPATGGLSNSGTVNTSGIAGQQVASNDVDTTTNTDGDDGTDDSGDDTSTG
jgi:hypothetical protein